MRLKLRCGGISRVVDLPDDTTVASLAAAAASTFSVPLARVTLAAGFPSAPLGATAALKDGLLVDVRVAEPPPPIARHAVAADNSCLFASVIFSLSLPLTPAQLRAEAAAAVAADPEAWSEGVLGRAPSDYCKYIQGRDTWGGAIELSIFAAKHEAELVAVEVRSGTVYVFGEGAGFARRAFFVFDGLHYDPMVRGAERTFAPTDEGARAGVEAFVADLRARHEFTDLENFTLRCGDCAKGLVGEADAQKHARETGHRNFQEYAAAGADAPATAAAAPTEWACPVCTLVNGANEAACGACEGARL